MEGDENPLSLYFDSEADEVDDGRLDAGEDNDGSLTQYLGSAASASFPCIENDDIDADNVEAEDVEAEELDKDDNTGTQEVHSIVPTPGMKFKDENEIFEFYKNYAYQVGFPVRKRNSRKGEDGIVRYVSFTCSREGRRTTATSSSLNPQPTIQTGCKARVTACSEISGAWRINTVFLEHNHRTSPSKSRLYRCNREISARVKRQLEINDIAGIPLHKSFNSAVVEAGGYDKLSCIEKDCRNFIDKVRRLRLGEGDAIAIQAFFSKMQTSSPGFYFSIDLDEDCRLRNVFWADNRCREAYKEFGDVVTFDTTYLTNKYDMPFAPFVGVNHHGQSTLLGCGLISNEDTSTFVWLFKTWLECMHSKAPNGIITDQDRAMQNAIGIVFPNTRHRWCLWHILKKLPEKFGNHRQKDSIMFNVHGLVYDTQSPQEFEEKWHTMLARYELEEHGWLTGLYNERSRWVPCYLKTSFWAGMSTTQRSESINAFFDGYVHSKTTLKQFVEQYERALRCKVEKEFQADFRSFSQMVPCATRYDMEKQFQSVYTISKFKEFQQEFTGKVYCEIVSATESYFEPTYEVREDIISNEGMKKQIFTVSFRRDTCEFECSCHLYEFRGIVCKHAISVLIRNDVALMPEKYILKRWRRDVNRPYTRVPVNYDGFISSAEQVRYEQLCSTFTKLADVVAYDEERSRRIMDLIVFETTEESRFKSTFVGGSQCVDIVACASGSILDPKYIKRKGAPRKLRRKGHLETSSSKSKSSRKGPTNPTTSKICKRQKKGVSSTLTVEDGGTQDNLVDRN